MPPVEGGVVAVTGASGFIGSWVVVELLRAGYEVRALVRDASNEAKTAHLLTKARELGKEAALRFFSGDLSQAGDYDEAFSGADAVVHTAAVVAIRAKDPLRDIVEPSIIGTQNVLASADRSKTVKRIIHTSSVAAIQSYDKKTDYIFTERDEATWSTIARGDPYGYAKLSAERLVREAGLASPLYDTVSINPVVVFGPCLTKAHTKASPSFLRQFLYGNKAPDAWVSVVDVRDVAAAHVVALNKVECAGQRYIIGTYRRTANERVLRAKLKLCQTNRSHRPCMPFRAACKRSGGFQRWSVVDSRRQRGSRLPRPPRAPPLHPGLASDGGFSLAVAAWCNRPRPAWRWWCHLEWRHTNRAWRDSHWAWGGWAWNGHDDEA